MAWSSSPVNITGRDSKPGWELHIAVCWGRCIFGQCVLRGCRPGKQGSAGKFVMEYLLMEYMLGKCRAVQKMLTEYVLMEVM